MDKAEQADVRQVCVRVNGIRFDSVLVRHVRGSGDFEIVIDDPCIGLFALTPAVPNLELREGKSDWRQVTLADLKKRLSGAAEAQRDSFNALVAEGEQVMNAEVALFRAGIPFLQLPFQQDRFASNLFMVPNVAKAKLCLLRAGFQEKRESETVLIDCHTGKPIQLIEGKCKPQDNRTT